MPIKVFYLSFFRVGTFLSYRLPDMEYGGMLIFYGILPAYYFNLTDKDCGEFIPEIESLAKQNKRDVFSIINHILKETTKNKLQTHPHLGNMKYFSLIIKDYAQEDRIMPLEIFNIDPYWTKLSAVDIKR